MSDCIFCKIIDGELPSAKVYEDEYVYAFMDIGQVTEGHVLLIPKKHYENIYEMDEKTASDLFKVAPKIANGIKEAFNPKGMNLVNNNGSFADQSVFHFHIMMTIHLRNCNSLQRKSLQRYKSHRTCKMTTKLLYTIW